jgi:hypothetical protein
MKRKWNLLIMVAILTSCSQSGNKDQSTTDKTIAKQEGSPKSQPEAGDEKKISSDNPIIGEWDQIYAVFDQNGNALLEPEERNGTKSNLGFNYFQFNSDGSCLRDKDVKFEGTWEIVEKDGKRKLHVTVNGFGETYKYTIMDPVTNELLLYSSGVFMIFKRI